MKHYTEEQMQILRELVRLFPTAQIVKAKKSNLPAKTIKRNDLTAIYIHERAYGLPREEISVAHLGKIADMIDYIQVDGVKLAVVNDNMPVAILDAKIHNDDWDAYGNLSYEDKIELLDNNPACEFVQYGRLPDGFRKLGKLIRKWKNGN